MPARRKPNELSITRIYDAPVRMVWEAWVDPEKVAKWWGPRGFTLTTKQKDVRVGGTWTYVMHGPDGTDYPNKTLFHEVDKYSRLVYDHGGNDDRPPMFRVTVLFSENSGKTTMEMTMTLPTAEAAAETKKFVKKAGGDGTWDRLAEYLAGDDRFVVNRCFENVSIEKVFDAWTDPNQLSQWLPPTGMSMKFIRAEIREGGTSFYSMEGSNLKMFGKATYREIRRPDRIVYTQNFVDENENISRHPLAPTWPETMLTTVIFTAEDESRTRITVTTQIEGDATAAEREMFRASRAGMTQGWTGSFDKLEDHFRLIQSGG